MLKQAIGLFLHKTKNADRVLAIRRSIDLAHDLGAPIVVMHAGVFTPISP
jgi:sugar phosphate isomerase/epimerase